MVLVYFLTFQENLPTWEVSPISIAHHQWLNRKPGWSRLVKHLQEASLINNQHKEGFCFGSVLIVLGIGLFWAFRCFIFSFFSGGVSKTESVPTFSPPSREF